jgi:hypothetical protein
LFENPQRTDWADEILCAYYGGEFLYTQRMVITDRLKYVFNGFDIDELYDLATDPDELQNQVANTAHGGQADEMRERMYTLMDRVGDPYGTGPQTSHGGERPNRYCAERYLPRPRRG